MGCENVQSHPTGYSHLQEGGTTLSPVQYFQCLNYCVSAIQASSRMISVVAFKSDQYVWPNSCTNLRGPNIPKSNFSGSSKQQKMKAPLL